MKKLGVNEDKYIYYISTSRPAPGVLSINYSLDGLPMWVVKSNYVGTGVPKDSTTLGIKDLISGVYDAYHNISKEYFSINITLK